MSLAIKLSVEDADNRPSTSTPSTSNLELPALNANEAAKKSASATTTKRIVSSPTSVTTMPKTKNNAMERCKYLGVVQASQTDQGASSSRKAEGKPSTTSTAVGACSQRLAIKHSIHTSGAQNNIEPTTFSLVHSFVINSFLLPALSMEGKIDDVKEKRVEDIKKKEYTPAIAAKQTVTSLMSTTPRTDQTVSRTTTKAYVSPPIAIDNKGEGTEKKPKLTTAQKDSESVSPPATNVLMPRIVHKPTRMLNCNAPSHNITVNKSMGGFNLPFNQTSLGTLPAARPVTTATLNVSFKAPSSNHTTLSGRGVYNLSKNTVKPTDGGQLATVAKQNIATSGIPTTTKTNVADGYKSTHTASYPSQKGVSSSPKSIASTPMLYVGITMERPETSKSWGLIFTKEKANHALIVRVIPSNNVAEKPTAKWCQVTNLAPNPSTVYRTTTTSVVPLDQYESAIAQKFPPPCDEKLCRGSDLCMRYLIPGDAIISINGIPVSSFSTTGKFASYIRENCQRKMIIVALRHEAVWKSAMFQMAQPILSQVQPKGPQGGLVDIQKMMIDRVSKAVQHAWKRVLSYGEKPQVKRKATSHPPAVKIPKIAYTNSMFRDKDGKPILYCDNDDDLDPDDGKRVHGFVNDEIEKSFPQWLTKRKATWSESRPKKDISHAINDEIVARGEEDKLTVQHEFWLSNGHESFGEWMLASKAQWARSYSWHKQGRNQLQSECEREVHFPMVAATIENHILLNKFESWLGVRKQQWRLERRKRQRLEMSNTSAEDDIAVEGESSGNSFVNNDTNHCAANSKQDMYIDEILEDQERLTREVTPSQPLDVSWVFDSQLGAPDDIIVNLMTFLLPSDHGNLLCLSYTSNYLFKQRDVMWRTLCPTHWVLPRRPRKSWCVMYITKIRAEEEAARKRSDDLLIKANVIIEKGDQLIKLEKLIKQTEKNFDFSVNYISGVVLERNSLLNLAVIDKRHKIIKWLIEEKGADIESCDRGQFTPLMNAAWNGDRFMVRFLLGKGCDRTKVGYNHSSQGLAPPTFDGMNAEGWACKRGHDDVAKLIRLGL